MYNFESFEDALKAAKTNFENALKEAETLVEVLREMNELEQKEQKYCLNVYTEMPEYYEWCYYIEPYGDVKSFKYTQYDYNVYFENTILFKDQKSAETYKELRQDMKKLSKEFKGDNYAFRFSPLYNEVIIGFRCDFNYGCYYYTEENAQFILDKYGQEVLKNYILYCK